MLPLSVLGVDVGCFSCDRSFCLIYSLLADADDSEQWKKRIRHSGLTLNRAC